MEIISLNEAKINNLQYYFTGQICKNGHISKRITSNRYCLECSLINSKEFKNRNPQSYKKYLKNECEKRKKDRLNNPEKYRDYEKTANRCKNKRRLARKEWVKNNKEKLNNYYKNYRKNPENKIRHYLRTNLNKLIKSNKNIKKEKLSYSSDELKLHLEKQFLKGMSWENYGVLWHIDHIIPIDYFLKNKITEVNIINSLTNLRPLFSIDNLKKSNYRTLLL